MLRATMLCVRINLPRQCLKKRRPACGIRRFTSLGSPFRAHIPMRFVTRNCAKAIVRQQRTEREVFFFKKKAQMTVVLSVLYLRSRPNLRTTSADAKGWLGVVGKEIDFRRKKSRSFSSCDTDQKINLVGIQLRIL